MPGSVYALANVASRCQLFNLGTDENGGGPFAIVQNAYDPEDARMAEALFVLLRDGSWIDELALGKLPEDQWFEILFATAAEAALRLESLDGAPLVIVRVPLTEQDLQARLAAWQGGGFQQRVQLLVSRYREHQRK